MDAVRGILVSPRPRVIAERRLALRHDAAPGYRALGIGCCQAISGRRQPPSRSMSPGGGSIGSTDRHGVCGIETRFVPPEQSTPEAAKPRQQCRSALAGRMFVAIPTAADHE